ncbi:TauD/TfdA family dioxygenase [Streptomyces kunmingensis]|uniref:TauD/TfdA family dioxygenase n=1 Tax=Streptomyces kunmingensis TaxID=68225 RepID=A0ABU6C2E1_9ACTN|nr:TauD/TfdA family dioxygenase [Streptomyces kunmingensis]MEB3958723.1 TauD/TfdA family dioxygenase [Streptomyces kunmingensis]
MTLDSGITTLDETPIALPWPRFSCPCPDCRHPGSFQKTAESTYWVDWLLDHAWDRGDSEQFIKETLRDSATPGAADMRPHQAADFHAGLGPWTYDLFTHGFALPRDTTVPQLERLLAEFDPVHHTEYGRYTDVTAVPETEDLSEMSLTLTAHTDYPYRTVGPLLEFCYFVENEAIGGEFYFLDGFKAVEDFRTVHPSWFTLLAETPVEFEQLYTSHHYLYLYRLRRPVTTVGPDEPIAIVGMSCRLPGGVTGPDSLWRLCSESYRITRRFEAGECLALRNTRILHGRHAFNPHSGTRRLVTAYIPWDQPEARTRFHRESPHYHPPAV